MFALLIALVLQAPVGAHNPYEPFHSHPAAVGVVYCGNKLALSPDGIPYVTTVYDRFGRPIPPPAPR